MEHRFDVLCVGRLAADLYASQIGVELPKVKQFNIYVGGCPANVVVGTRRLGLRTAMLSRVGTDGIADGLVNFLKDEGINTDSVARDASHLTGLAFLSILPPDTFPLVYYRADPADLYLNLDDIAQAPIEQSRALFVSGTCFSADPSRGTVLAAMERSRASGNKVILDIDLRKTLWKDLRAFGVNMRSAARLSHIIIGTEDEIASAADSADIDSSVKVLLGLGVEAVAVKRGGAGAEVFTPDGKVHRARPFKVDILNVLGAGDAWASGFIYGYLHDWDWEKCARFGNATGAIIVTRHACANDMPTFDEAMALVNAQGGF